MDFLKHTKLYRVLINLYKNKMPWKTCSSEKKNHLAKSASFCSDGCNLESSSHPQ